jgi:hypothetical protein
MILRFQDVAACFVVRDHSGRALAYVYFEMSRGEIGGQLHDVCDKHANFRELLGNGTYIAPHYSPVCELINSCTNSVADE